MSALPIIITTAGRNALVNAQNTGVSNVVIASLGVSPTAITATIATTAIPGEIKRIAGVSGQVVANDQIYISAPDQTADTYTVRTIGLYLNTGVLFAVFSQATPLLEKSGAAMAVLEAAIKLSSPLATTITFTGGGWLNPQASETVQGVLRLATEAEAKAGTHTTRAVTPKGLKGAIDVVVTWINQEFDGIAQALAGKAAAAHTHVMADITGLATALNNKAAAAHTHVMADITGLVDALNGKAATVHSHAMSSIDGLSQALAGKAAAAHTHVMTDITGLAEALAGKAAAAHSHVMSEITGLSAALSALLPKTGGTVSGLLTIKAHPASAGMDVFALIPTDYAPGKPGLFLKQQAEIWSVTLFDGQAVSGALNIEATGLALNGAAVWTSANFNPALKANLNTPVFTGGVGAEGGEIRLARPTSGTALDGDLAIDLQGNRLRFFESNGRARGLYVDLTEITSGQQRIWHSANFDPAGKSNTGHKHDAGDTTSGVFDVGRIPALPMEKITSLATAIDARAPKSNPVFGGSMRSTGNNFELPGEGSYFGFNLYYNGAWRYRTASHGWYLRHGGANFEISYAASGAVDAVATILPRMRIDGATGKAYLGSSEIWSAANFDPTSKAPAIHSHDWAQITGKGDVVLKSATGLGVTGQAPLTSFANANEYSSLPTGWTSMMVPETFGLPGGYGYLMKTGRRDNGEGWSGMFTSHATAVGERASLWFGSTPDANTMPTWSRAWSDANLLAASPAEAAAGVASDRFITPAALWSFARNLGSPGYAVIPGTDLMIQWGISTASIPEGETHAYLPVAFGGGCLVALANPRNPTRSIGIDFYMQVVGHFADRIAFFANRGNSSSGNVAGYEWVALGRISGSPDPAYSSGGGGGGGGNPEIFP